MKVVVISPHPDDLELFCGGTVMKHVRKGDEVVEILVTDGQRGSLLSFLTGGPSQSLGKKRREEARRAASFLGIKLKTLGLVDRGLDENLGPLLLKALREESPSLVYAPDPEFASYHHPDHLAVGRSVSSFRPVRFYHTTKPNLRVDIREVLDKKIKAVKIHRSQWWVWGLLFPLRGRRISLPFEEFREIK
jgi:LmbE family N-acetylglucosaminyl deacetylase